MFLFSSIFVQLPFSLCMESGTSYVFLFRIVFFYLVTTGWILTSAYNVGIQSIDQSVKRYKETLEYALHEYIDVLFVINLVDYLQIFFYPSNEDRWYTRKTPIIKTTVSLMRLTSLQGS